MPRKDITGQRFGRLIALELVPMVVNGHHRTYWKFQCDCGETITVRTDGVIRGAVKSCGCFQKETMSDRMRGGNDTSFKKNFIPHNKGRKRSEWMSDEKSEHLKEMSTGRINQFYAENPQHLAAVSEANKKPVVQLTILGSVVAFHDSVNSAAKAINRTPSSISRVCCHRGISSGGFGFVFLDEYLSNRVPTTNIKL